MLDVVSTGSVEPIERPVDDSPSGWVWTHQQRLVIPDLSVEKRFSAALDSFRARGSRSLVALPMTTADKQLGALVFGNDKAQRYSSETLRQLDAVAGLVAMGMENSMAKHALTGDEDPLRLLTAITIKLS